MNKWNSIFNNPEKLTRVIKITAAVFIVSGLLAAASFFALRHFGDTGSVYRSSVSVPVCNYIVADTANLPVTFVTVPPVTGIFAADRYDGDYGAGSREFTDESRQDRIIVKSVSETPVSVTVENGSVIKIEQDPNFAVSLFVLRKYGITVYLPDRLYRRVTVRGAGGDVHIRGVQTEFADVRTNSGNVVITDCDTNLNISTRAGNVNVTYSAFEYPSRIEAPSGSVTVRMFAGQTVNLDYLTKDALLSGDFFSAEDTAQRTPLFLANGVGGKKLSVETPHLTVMKRQS